MKCLKKVKGAVDSKSHRRPFKVVLSVIFCDFPRREQTLTYLDQTVTDVKPGPSYQMPSGTLIHVAKTAWY